MSKAFFISCILLVVSCVSPAEPAHFLEGEQPGGNTSWLEASRIITARIIENTEAGEPRVRDGYVLVSYGKADGFSRLTAVTFGAAMGMLVGTGPVGAAVGAGIGKLFKNLIEMRPVTMIFSEDRARLLKEGITLDTLPNLFLNDKGLEKKLLELVKGWRSYPDAESEQLNKQPRLVTFDLRDTEKPEVFLTYEVDKDRARFNTEDVLVSLRELKRGGWGTCKAILSTLSP